MFHLETNVLSRQNQFPGAFSILLAELVLTKRYRCIGCLGFCLCTREIQPLLYLNVRNGLLSSTHIQFSNKIILNVSFP